MSVARGGGDLRGWTRRRRKRKSVGGRRAVRLRLPGGRRESVRVGPRGQVAVGRRVEADGRRLSERRRGGGRKRVNPAPLMAVDLPPPESLDLLVLVLLLPPLLLLLRCAAVVMMLGTSCPRGIAALGCCARRCRHSVEGRREMR